jgi:hypothetical protein
MKSSKYINGLKQLEPRERSKYKELVYSPFFNKNKKVRLLVDYTLRFAPDFTASALAKEQVFKAVFGPQAVYHELKLNNVISDALKLLYIFLAQQAFMQQESNWRPYQLDALLSRRMTRHLPASERRMGAMLDNSPYMSYAYYYQKHKLAGQLDRSTLIQTGREYSPHLQDENDALDQFYWCNKLRLACDMASRNKIIKAAYQCHFLEDLLAVFEQQKRVLKEQAAIQLYYQAYQMISTEEEEHYHALRSSLHEFSKKIPLEERHDLYDYAQNYCVKKINLGYTKYYRYILDLYKEMLEQEVLLRDGYLTQWSYINILTAGLRLPDYEWTEWFIYNYKGQLQPKVRHNVFTYSLAALYFEKEEYYRAIQTLQDVHFSDIFYHLSAKIIQLKSYYELEENEAFLSLLEASKKFLSRNRQLSDYQVQSNSNFLKMAGKLHKINMNMGIANTKKTALALHQLEKALSATHVMANKGWLMQKVGRLKSSLH